MKIAVSAMANTMDAPFSPMFGRCPYFVVVETDTMAYEVITNAGMSASGGAGIQAAQDVVGRGAACVITGHVGPNAYQALSAARLPVYGFVGGTVREAVEAYRAGRLVAISEAAPAHMGIGMGHGHSGGRGMGGRRDFGGPHGR